MDGRIAISLNVPLLRPGINSEVTVMRNKNNKTMHNTASPRGRRDDMPPADGSSTRGGSTSVRGRVRCPHICGGRPAAGSQRAYSLGWKGQTDGRIAVSLMRPPLRRRGHNKKKKTVAICRAAFAKRRDRERKVAIPENCQKYA